MKKHSWQITHFVEQAKHCKNRKVDSELLKARPWLKGTCHICSHYKPEKHKHTDSPSDYKHQHCLNYEIS